MLVWWYWEMGGGDDVTHETARQTVFVLFALRCEGFGDFDGLGVEGWLAGGGHRWIIWFVLYMAGGSGVYGIVVARAEEMP